MSVVATFDEKGDMSVGHGTYNDRKRNYDRTVPVQELPTVDLVETNDEYKVISDIPGIDDPKELDVWLEGSDLCIKANRVATYDESDAKVHKRSLQYSAVERHVRLPKNAALDKVQTMYKNGVLTVLFPKYGGSRVEPESKTLTINTA